MDKKDLLTKILAVVGTVLVWLPILAPLFFSAFFLLAVRRFRFDYLMPAELFPLVLVGGALLLWAALRSRCQRALIGAGFGLSAGLLVGGQFLAVVSGLASGDTEPEGAWWMLLLASLIVYTLAVVATGVGGVRLLRQLFKPSQGKKQVP